MSQQIGDMIYALRTEKGISQKELARGILSVPELSRIERAEKETDHVTLEALFQRLGKSMDKLELAIPESEYRVILLRTLILDNLLKGHGTFTEELFQKYEAAAENKKPLYRQYLLKMRSVSAYMRNHDAEKCMESLKKALQITFPKWEQTDWKGVFLCTQELQLFLMIAYLKLERGDRDTADLLERLSVYIETYYTDEEEKSRIYPQCLWLRAKCCLKRGKRENVCRFCDEGIACLTKNGKLTMLDELLQIKWNCLQAMGKADTIEGIRIEKQREAIRFVYELSKHRICQDELLLLIRVTPNNEFLISNELIRELRRAEHMSQEELIADICTRETLSRIESGKRDPSRKKLEQFMGRLKVDPDYYSGFLFTSDYQLLEKARNFNRNWFAADTEKAHEILDELEAKLDMSLSANKQYIANARIMEKIQEKEITFEKAYVELKEILRYTMKSYQGKVYRLPSRTECTVLNHMALCKKCMKEWEEAKEIYEQMLEQYERSHVDEIHHALSLLLIYLNYAALLEECNELEKSEKMGKRGIRLAINCERGDALGILLANLSCVYEKRNLPEDKRKLEASMCNSYYFLDMFGHKHNARIMKENCEKTLHIQMY